MNLLQNFEAQHWESRMDDPITSEVSTSATKSDSSSKVSTSVNQPQIRVLPQSAFQM